MLTRNRKEVQSLIHSMAFLKDRNTFWCDEFIRLRGEKGYQALLGIYDEMIEKLSQERDAMPIGFRYSGTFYIKKPYTTPTVFEKVEGSAYMREDLISWDITPKMIEQGYFRAIYREPHDRAGSQITREEAEPVYASEITA